MNILDKIKWDANEMVPMVAQDEKTRDILMVGWANREAMEKTINTGLATYWSRSRDTLWTKGESSGNTLDVKELWFDCDIDTVIALVEPHGAACHEGYQSCFYRRLEPISTEGELVVHGERLFDPKEVYGKKEDKKEAKE